jgi:hypothetical protein
MKIRRYLRCKFSGGHNVIECQDASELKGELRFAIGTGAGGARGKLFMFAKKHSRSIR